MTLSHHLWNSLGSISIGFRFPFRYHLDLDKTPSGADDARMLFADQGEEHPRFLAKLTPELRTIYVEWHSNNRDRILAVIAAASGEAPYPPI